MRYKKTRKKKVEKKEKTKVRKSVLVFFFLILLVFGYMFIQYMLGINKSMDEANIDQIDYEFNGKQDQYGGTNVLLIGSDSRGEKNERSRSDTIMIRNIIPKIIRIN